jgi:SAM-dependent methyltransferase
MPKVTRPSAPTDVRHRLAQRALERQLDYQKDMAVHLSGAAAESIGHGKRTAVAALLAYTEITDQTRVLEVGGGGKGLLHYLPCARLRFGADPLAVDYSVLYPDSEHAVQSCAALGESLPIRDGAFDVVLCDNVIDHAEDPEAILSELARVLKAGGTLFFTVNVHHPIYHLAARLYSFGHRLGLRVEIGPFADHTVHLTVAGLRRMLAKLPLDTVAERDGIAAAREKSRMRRARHAGDLLKRPFFKNARYVLIATKRGR